MTGTTRQGLTAAQRSALNLVALAAEKPRAGGYAVDAAVVRELTEKGLVKIDAFLTDAGREALEQEATGA